MSGLTPPRAPVAGLSCTPCTRDDLLALLRRRLSDTPAGADTLTVLCVNAHIYNLAWSDARLRATLEGAQVTALDGMSMVWTARRQGLEVPQRCNMTESFRAFLDDPDAPPSRALLIGLDEASARRAAAVVNARGGSCRVVRAVSGYERQEDYARILREEAADLVLLGCGTPRSEQLADRLAEEAVASVIWHVGGGTLRFLAGSAREAPAWMRATGLQWLHRLASDPRGMWRRYLLGNPAFVWRALVRGGIAR